MPRDEAGENTEVPEKQELQRHYRQSLESGEGIYYPVSDHKDVRLQIHDLKSDLNRLRRNVQLLLMGLAVALLVIGAGVYFVIRSQDQQQAKLDVVQDQQEEIQGQQAEIKANLQNELRLGSTWSTWGHPQTRIQFAQSNTN